MTPADANRPGGRRMFERVSAFVARDPSVPGAAGAEADAAEDEAGVAELRERVTRLEQALEAVQDAAHRESQRRDAELADLRRQLQPQELARALSEDARRRGL